MSKEKKVKKPRISAGKLARREAMAGYLFVLPWMIGVVIFLLRPLFTSFQFSLNNIRITPKGRMFNFVGYQNYTQIWLEDPEFPVELMGYMWSTLLCVCLDYCHAVKWENTYERFLSFDFLFARNYC